MNCEKSQNQNFEKMKKNAGDIIILQMCTKNQSHEVRFWGMAWEFFVILGNFLLFYPPNNSKIKILKKWSKHLQISSFHTCAPKNTIIWCMLTQIWSATGMTFWYFRSFFALLPHYLPWKLQFGKNVKSIW